MHLQSPAKTQQVTVSQTELCLPVLLKPECLYAQCLSSQNRACQTATYAIAVMHACRVHPKRQVCQQQQFACGRLAVTPYLICMSYLHSLQAATSSHLCELQRDVATVNTVLSHHYLNHARRLTLNLQSAPTMHDRQTAAT